MKTTFISTKAYPGVSAFGIHGQGAKLWGFKYLEDITEKIESDLTIFGAYHPDYEKIEVIGKRAITFHSSPFEMEQTTGIEFQQLSRIINLKKEDKIDYVFSVNEDIAKFLKTQFIPHPIDINIKPKEIVKEDAIGFFVPGKFSKNITTQLLSAKSLELNLFTNIESHKPLMDWMDLKYKLVGWKPKSEYFDLISKMRLNLHCSWSESFAYGVAESFLLSTPVIISPTISWVEDTYLRDVLMVENPNSSIEIASKIKTVLGMNEGDYGFLQNSCRKQVENVALRNNQKIREILDLL